MRDKTDNVGKNIAICSVVSALSLIGAVTVVNADNSDVEQEFLSIMDKHKSDNVVVENGISVKRGETIDLTIEDGWLLSNEGTVSVDEGGVLRPIAEGTVFLSNEIDGKIRVIEVYVSDSEPLMVASVSRATLNRDYYKVFIDPGHGGSDNGASGFGNLEDEVNLKISKLVESKLKAKGVEVKMSRTSDVYLSLSERARLANNYGADVFLSIHQNAASVESAEGIETFFHSSKSAHKPLSEGIQTTATKDTSAKNRGVKSENFGVLRESNMPSALFEGGFLTNQKESAKLGDPAYQDKLATAIVKGIDSYLKANIQLNNGSGDTNNGSDIELPVLKNGTITTDSLNVRSGAGTSYAILGKLNKGAKVDVVGEANGWSKIKYNKGYAYVSSSYVSSTNVNNPDLTVIAKGDVIVNDLNVRTGAGTSNSVIGKLNKGAKVDIVARTNGWSKIKYGSGYAYVSADCVQEVSDSIPSTPKPDPTPPPTITIKYGEVYGASSLNVRSGYGTSNGVIGSLKSGSKVEIVESKNGWHKVKYNNGYGYVSGDYIKESGKPSTPTPTPPVNNVTTKKGVVITSSLNVRSGYGTSNSKIGTLSSGKGVEIVESKNGWHKIKFDGGYGYVSGDYIKVSGTTTPTPPPTSAVKKGTVTTNNLNVRKGASTSYATIGKLNSGTKVDIVSTSGGWHKIKYGQGYGYISADYVKL